jgi:HD-GYP domain-containing protein (c-di-GMP phosphodiesterase class II)
MDPRTEKTSNAPSVVQMINAAHRRLEQLLFNLENERNAQTQIMEVVKTLIAATDMNKSIALGSILLNRNEGSYAIRHCIDSAIVALLLARALDKSTSEILSIMAATLTMNVGMLQHQEQLQTRVGAISDQEIARIHRHPQDGVDVLTKAGVDDADWLSYVLLHHENEDGSGYPSGKMGDDIPLSVKIISLADRYCARVSSRNYRKSLLPKEALSDILLADQRSIDPMLTTCFIQVVGVYPTGAIVRLANGELGVVASRGSDADTPVVHALVGANGVPLSPSVTRNTANEEFSIQMMLSEEQAGFRFNMQQVWGEQARA